MTYCRIAVLLRRRLPRSLASAALREVATAHRSTGAQIACALNVPGVRSAMVRITLVAVVAALSLAGCYHPIVTKDGFRPGTFETLMERTENARGIRATRQVGVRVVAARDLEPIASKAMHTDWSDDELARYEQSLIIVGLWPPGRDLSVQVAATIGAEAIGLYVPDEHTLYVVRDPAIPWRVRFVSALAHRDIAREYALTHELVHFLQHQEYPGLFDTVLHMKHSDDAAWAGQAAIEGDAVRYGFAALGSSMHPPSAVDFERELELAASHGAFAKQPRLISESMVFPYISGYRLSTLEATLLLDEPPASTEQAMHVSRRHEPFTVIDFTRPAAPGCTPLWSNSLGELGISILLREYAPATRASAWEGWNGDRYLAMTCDGSHALVWLTTWDSDDDAREFASAYQSIAPAIAARAGLAAAPVVEVSGKDAIIYTRSVAVFAASAASSAGRRTVRTLSDVAENEEIRPVPTR